MRSGASRGADKVGAPRDSFSQGVTSVLKECDYEVVVEGNRAKIMCNADFLLWRSGM